MADEPNRLDSLVDAWRAAGGEPGPFTEEIVGCAGCPLTYYGYGTEATCGHPKAPETDDSVADGFGRVFLEPPGWCPLRDRPFMVRMVKR